MRFAILFSALIIVEGFHPGHQYAMWLNIVGGIFGAAFLIADLLDFIRDR